MSSGAIVIPFAESYPWLLPGAILALVAGIVASRPLARWLGVTRLVAGVMIVTVGVILAATLTPPGCTCASGLVAGRSCDLSRIGFPTPAELFAPTDVLGNVIGFIPLGFAIALVPRSRRKVAVLAAAIALPFAIEAIQLVVIPLGRACQSGDVIDNLTGLFLGLAAGTVAVWVTGHRGAEG